MRVAIITESFPPDVNGVAHCVLRVAELLARGGHHPLVIAPQPPRAKRDEKASYPFPVVRVPAVPLPGYPGFRLGLPGRRVRTALIRHRAELVHLASPVVLGAHGAAVARRLGLPTVAVYQTDLPSYARAYRLGPAGEAFAWRWLRGIHNGAARTLAPSTVTATGLLGQGIENVWLWGRGVDTRRFHPARRSPQIRAELAPDGELIAGYVGRWPPRNGSTCWPGSPRWTGSGWSSSGPGAGRAGPAGTVPASRRPRPRGTVRLGHGHPRLSRRSRGRGRRRDTAIGMTRFAALGDSITVGMGDPAPGGGWRGWATLLAGTLPQPELHNLATLGALAADVERAQLPAAMALRPDVASVVVGINDTLRGDFDPERTGTSIDRTVAALRATGAEVLTMRLPDPGQMFGLPGALARPLARRMRAVNARHPTKSRNRKLRNRNIRNWKMRDWNART